MSDYAEKSKYHNKKVEYDGFVFDSKKEANRYAKLRAVEKLGGIRNLRRQVPFVLQPAFRFRGKYIPAIKYVADFVYEAPDENGNVAVIVEDVKGFRTAEYKLKAKLFLFKYGFEIREE